MWSRIHLRAQHTNSPTQVHDDIQFFEMVSQGIRESKGNTYTRADIFPHTHSRSYLV